MHRLRSASQRVQRDRSPHRANGHATVDADDSSVEPDQNGHPLQASVLVLNRLYSAVHIASVRRTFGLLCRDLAEVIHLEPGPAEQSVFANYDFETWLVLSELRAECKQPHEDWVRSVNFEVQVPRVIRLLSYDQLPKRKLHLTRRGVLARDGNLCQYCGRRYPVRKLSVDHVVPRSRGGLTTWENVVCACLPCNLRKGGNTPKEAGMSLVRRPVRPKQSPVLSVKLGNPKYKIWEVWLNGVCWDL